MPSPAREALLGELRLSPSGLVWCRRHSDLVDDTIRRVAEEVGLEGLAIIATGGYGRREMSPYSDVDLTVIPRHEGASGVDERLRALYRALNVAVVDSLGLELGYAFRLASDAAGLDVKTRTGLLDARLVAGDPVALTDLLERLEESFAPAEFLLAKLEERRVLMARHHATPRVAEPQLKEGAGGLRCFHSEEWIRYALGERGRSPDASFETVLQARNLLHLVAQRKTDGFARSRHGEVAFLLGVEPPEMMRSLLAAMEGLAAGYGRAVERIGRADFALSPGAVAEAGAARPLAGSDAAVCAVGIARASRLGLRVSELPIAVAPSRDGPALMHALAYGARAVRDLDRCGLLGSLLPELEAVRFLVPPDGTHVYTVFEHSIRLVDCLDELPDAALRDLEGGLADRGALVLAALLHDVGKVDPAASHADLGAQMAEVACERLGIPKESADLIVWLVREHLTMVRFLRIRDVTNPETIVEFARLVENRARLDALTLLTYTDVNAVGTGVWTPAQDASLRELFARTAVALDAGEPSVVDPGVTRRRLKRRLSASPPERVEAFVESLPATYLVSTPTDAIEAHFIAFVRAQAGEPTIEIDPRPDLGVTEFTVCAPDASGLLEAVLGAFYAFDLSVGGYRVATTRTEPPVALDVLSVSIGGRPVPVASAEAVAAALLKILRGEELVADLLRRRGKDPDRPARILRHSLASASPAILEIRAPRGRGLPYRLAKWIAAQGWEVSSARLGQWGADAAAAFSIERPGSLTAEELDRAISSLDEDAP